MPVASRLARRALPGLGAALLLPRRGLAQPGAYRFRLLREGEPVGTHVVEFARAEGQLTARSTLQIQVKVMGFTVFRFLNRQEEVWRGEALVSATGRRERNGRVDEMTARAEAGGILVRGSGGEQRYPANAAPFAWWDSRRPGRLLFDGASGKQLDLRWNRSATPDGGVVWRAMGEIEGEVAYGADGTWRGLTLKGEDGSQISYVVA